MSAPTTSKVIQIDRKCGGYRSVFLREQSELDWPEEHHEKVKHVKELARMRYDSYDGIKNVHQYDSWKLQAKERAALLAELAHRCEGRREATSRFHCERAVFSRFNSEVTWYEFSV